ncbi:hypothetical protein [Streptomyces sp. NPDC046862]|uniref:hypothetical protein n=1 Tax=Streptomyces sp. NPDC046862 TaxID=3154603 RepID=UPI003451DFE8
MIKAVEGVVVRLAVARPERFAPAAKVLWCTPRVQGQEVERGVAGFYSSRQST